MSSLYFNGSTLYNIPRAGFTSSVTINEITIEAWVNVKELNRWHTIYQLGGSSNGIALGVTNTNKVRLASLNLTGGVNSEYNVLENEWFHVAGVFNSEGLKLYINGELDSELAISSMTINTGTISNAIGGGLGQSTLTGTGVSNFLNGKLSRVRIWSLTRTSEQIKTNINRDYPETTDGLVIAYNFDEGQGIIANPLIQTVEAPQLTVSEDYWSEDSPYYYRMLLKNNSTGGIYSLKEKTLIILPNTSLDNLIKYGIRPSEENSLIEYYDKILTVNEDGSSVEEVVSPFSVYNYISETPQVLINKEYNEDVLVTTTTESFDLYDELEDEVEVIYYIEDELVNQAELILDSNYSPIDNLQGDFRIVTWNESSNMAKLSIDGLKNIQHTTVRANGDISLYNVSEIESVFLNAIGDGKVLVSTDRGISWMTFNGSEWITVSDDSEGLSFSLLNNLTSEQLTKLITPSQTIRFAYYITENTEIDNIQMKVSMNGTEKLANTVDYTYRYDRNSKTIIYTINKSGTYSVNYLDEVQ